MMLLAPGVYGKLTTTNVWLLLELIFWGQGPFVCIVVT